MNERANRILEALAGRGAMDVIELADMTGVSPVTIRKDLSSLEKRGLIRREHGRALFGGSDDMNDRLAVHYEQKLLIAGEAARLVEPGETIMIESGSCCALTAERIALSRPGVTIITNSAFISGYIRHIEGVKVILLGGDLQPGAQVTVGPMLAMCAKQFYVSKLFIGVDGYLEKAGFMAADHLRAQAVRDMARQAGAVWAVTESGKFGRSSTVPLALGVKGVVTDASLDISYEKALIDSGVTVVKAGGKEG